jgi:hypothetical protein
MLGATLLTFEGFVRNGNRNDTRNDTVDLARRTLDLQAKQLRNLAKRVGANVIDTVEADQFIFQTSDPTRTWVRYCLDTSNPANGKLYQQTQSLAIEASSAPVTAGMRSGCPATSGWTRTELVAANVVNRIGGRNIPMFTYRCADGGTACTTPGGFDSIIGVNAQLYVDTTPTKLPEEDRVVSGVYLRNQNQAPIAEWTATTITSTPRTVLLNGSGSADYEQRTLSYFWFENTIPTAANVRCDLPGLPTDTTLWGGNLIGRGVTTQYTWPGTTPASGTSRTIGLVVCDPGDRPSSIVSQTVTIP